MLYQCQGLNLNRRRTLGTTLWLVVKRATQRSAIGLPKRLEWRYCASLDNLTGFYIFRQGQIFGVIMLVQCKIQEWQLKLKQRDCRIYIYKDDKEMKSVKTRIFKERVLLTLPKELYKLITKDITAANIFEKFMQKFWKWDEIDEC
jgi:hypothetical protein